MPPGRLAESMERHRRKPHTGMGGARGHATHAGKNAPVFIRARFAMLVGKQVPGSFDFGDHVRWTCPTKSGAPQPTAHHTRARAGTHWHARARYRAWIRMCARRGCPWRGGLAGEAALRIVRQERLALASGCARRRPFNFRGRPTGFGEHGFGRARGQRIGAHLNGR